MTDEGPPPLADSVPTAGQADESLVRIFKASTDLTQAVNVRRELLDDDAATRASFAQALAAELDSLAEALAESFGTLGPLLAETREISTAQAGLVASFALGVFDDLLVSTQLLLIGKLPAAGNLMRQAIEGIAMATLCAAADPVVIERRERGRGADKVLHDVKACYWKIVDRLDKRTEGQHAIRQLSWNATMLGLNPEAVAGLRGAQQRYHGLSHCGPRTIALRSAWDGSAAAQIGGHFEPAKLDFYRVELRERIGLSRMLPSFVEHLSQTTASRERRTQSFSGPPGGQEAL
ncbi:hypothetical protein [Burkholderia gladioli]|uniref:hypothetical protein n=1 Tax=Burkholderia gladioli TaxID=28095 RepID=UPI00139EF32E|nr:hypothetical protein [Burkholderia gladioli]KAF1065545.1 hypothetical protein LvStA_00037 [Burkholderia gladioli]